MIKKPNPTTKKNTDQKMTFDTYRHIFSWRMKPIAKEAIMLLIEEGIEWAVSNPKAYKVMTYFTQKGFCSEDIKRWTGKYPDFAAGYAQMKQIIGDRREIGALEKKLDTAIVLRSMHRYDSEWKEIDEYHAALRKTEEQQPTKITVELTPFPPTDVVPDKMDSTSSPRKEKK